MSFRPSRILLRQVAALKNKSAARTTRLGQASASPIAITATASPANRLHSNRSQTAWNIYLYGSAAIASVIGLYTAQLFIAANRPVTDPAVISVDSQKDVSDRYNDTAASFDVDVGFSEWLMGINGKRKGLAGLCRGHVLEASCGTGRNLGYFPILASNDAGAAIDSLTFVDLSPAMVAICKKKWEILHDNKKNKLRKGLTIRFLTGSVLDQLPPPPLSSTATAAATSPLKSEGSRRGYNTIIQTMGLCSTPTPEKLLVNLANHLDPNDPDAKILLLEHGRSYMPWLNHILDNSAAKHAEIHGCWYNRDIGRIVQDAARESGLVIARERRFHGGTTWLFELTRAKK